MDTGLPSPCAGHTKMPQALTSDALYFSNQHSVKKMQVFKRVVELLHILIP